MHLGAYSFGGIIMKKLYAIATIALALLLGNVLAEITLAQGPEIPPRPVQAFQQEPGSRLDPPNLPMTSGEYWAGKINPATAPQPADTGYEMPSTSGGPDDYGYVWTDNTSYQWISAASGFDTGINNSTYSAGPISIGFNFKYYENNYADLWISRYGFISFASNSLYDSQSHIPIPAPPNNVVAPHWVPVDSINGYVRYLRGGSAPNRWFAVEWNRLVSDYDTPDEYTFEVVLYENGSIVFQYQTMSVTGNWWCQSSGIEDSIGVDGLATSEYCRQIPAYHAVRITRPGPAARLQVFPTYYGNFGAPGHRTIHEIPIKNTGNAGVDTYDIQVTSRWMVRLFDSNGNLLSDTDGDGVIDSGPVGQNTTASVKAHVFVPDTASVGNSDTAIITFKSSRDPSKAKSATLQTAVPAPFVQAFIRTNSGTAQATLLRPDAQITTMSSPPDYYPYDPAVIEAPNGDITYIWSTGRCLNSCNTYINEIEYELLDHDGNISQGILKLTDNSNATINTYDLDPVVAVSPNGRIGILWRRYLYDSSGRYNYNMYFAVLQDDAVLYGPADVTLNPNWGAYGDPQYIQFWAPTIAATADNRFVLSWSRSQQETAGWVDDVWYAVRSSNGSIIRDQTRLTNDTPGYDDYFEAPSLTSIGGNRVALFLERKGNIYAALINSSGNVVRSLSQFTSDSRNWGRSNAATTSNGNMVVAWYGDPPRNPGERVWTAQYFNNETLSGSPVLTREEQTINVDWGTGSPGPGVNSDYFSVRWDGTIDVDAGSYQFWMGSDDGSRLWIDGQIVMDRWDECCEYWYTTASLAQGAHHIRMEIHEHDGAAWAYLAWQAINGPVIRYMIINPSFQTIAGPTMLSNPASSLGEAGVSVSNDQEGDAILTWTDYDRGYNSNLYYALIDGSNGNVLTQPMVFESSDVPYSYLSINYDGASTTTYTAQPYRTFLPSSSHGRLDLCEPNDGRSEARCALVSNRTYRASISFPNEWDFYIIDLPADHTAEIWLDNIPTGHDYNLYLFNAANGQVGYSGEVGNQSEHILTTVLPNGRYYVAVKGIAGSSASLRYSLKAEFR